MNAAILLLYSFAYAALNDEINTYEPFQNSDLAAPSSSLQDEKGENTSTLVPSKDPNYTDRMSDDSNYMSLQKDIKSDEKSSKKEIKVMRNNGSADTKKSKSIRDKIISVSSEDANNDLNLKNLLYPFSSPAPSLPLPTTSHVLGPSIRYNRPINTNFTALNPSLRATFGPSSSQNINRLRSNPDITQQGSLLKSSTINQTYHNTIENNPKALSQFISAYPTNKILLKKIETSSLLNGPTSLLEFKEPPKVEFLLQDLENRMNFLSSVASFVQGSIDGLLYMSQDVKDFIKKCQLVIESKKKQLEKLYKTFKSAQSQEEKSTIAEFYQNLLDETNKVKETKNNLEEWKTKLADGIKRLIRKAQSVA